MPRRHLAKSRANRLLKEIQPESHNVIQTNKRFNSIVESSATSDSKESVQGIENVTPFLEYSGDLQPGQSTASSISLSTAALHHELDSFRQRWRRELETKKTDHGEAVIELRGKTNASTDEDRPKRPGSSTKEFNSVTSETPLNQDEVYALARKLFLMGVELEHDEMHHESIRYYKQAVHLCPDIEKQIFREQCEASTPGRLTIADKTLTDIKPNENSSPVEENKLPLLNRVQEAFYTNSASGQFSYCRPSGKLKPEAKHISHLPHDLILQLFRYVIGQELDLASLESLGMVCRGFYILSNDPSLWRSICFNTWSREMLSKFCQGNKGDECIQVSWKQIYLTKPRVNCDGVYISRTKYIRQGDIGFQDITYRPFHVVRYYRYLRFFPDKRVLILTTSEEPDKIIPIFRHALHSKQFSPELSIMDGTYKLVNEDEVMITAEKDFTMEQTHASNQTYNQRRQAKFHWSKQTPQWQKLDLKFKLETIDSRQYRNNTLKWLGYSLMSRSESGIELTEFDIVPDTFPNLTFSRVKRFNLRVSEPLTSH